MKLKNLFMTLVMLLSVTTYTSCKNTQNNTQNNKADVQLVSVDGSRTVVKEESPKNARRILRENEGEVEETPEETTPEENYGVDTLGYNILILPTEVMQYDITINLDNPHDHSIQDFRIETSDPTLKMYNANLDRWDAVDMTKSIKWLGADNQSFKFTLLSSSEELASSIKITEILYLNRTAQKIENVNLSTGPDYVDIIKADMPTTIKEKVYNDANNYITIDYSVNFGKGVENVKIDGELVEEGKIYATKYGGGQKMTWELPYKTKSLPAGYEKDIFSSIYDVIDPNPDNSLVQYYDTGEYPGNPVDYSIVEVIIIISDKKCFYNEETDLKFVIKHNDETVELLECIYEERRVYDSIAVIYRYKVEDKGYDHLDPFSIYFSNGEEEIFWVTTIFAD